MKNNLKYSNKASLNYYKINRKNLSDLYKSEKKFFKNSVLHSNSFLDYGCNIGNFVSIIKEIKNTEFQYTGIDNNKKLINLAKKNNPNYVFKTIYNQKFSNKKKYDLVFSFGTLHHIKNWEKCIISLKKLTNKYLLFDIRLTESKTTNSLTQYQKIVFNSKWDKKSKIRYITINKNYFDTFIRANLNEFRIKKISYKSNVGKGYVGKHKTVLMTSVLCVKKL